MIEDDYTKLLKYLREKLENMQATDVVSEINNLMNYGKTVTIKDNSDLKEKKIKQSEVGKTQTLILTSKEAFELTIEYMEKIIIDVPSYSKKISSKFGKDVSWEYDQTESIKSLNVSADFDLNSFTFNQEELDKAKTILEKIKTLSGNNGNI